MSLGTLKRATVRFNIIIAAWLMCVRKTTCTVYMENNCHPVVANKGDLIRSQSTLTYRLGSSCHMMLFAPKPAIGILLQITSIDIPSTSNCSTSYLEIIPSPDLPGDKLCNARQSPLTFRSKDTLLSLNFVTNGHTAGRGFTATYTALYEAGGRACWNFDYMQCSNGLCISSTLTCDGVDHCGDKSDENIGKPSNCRERSLKYTAKTNGALFAVELGFICLAGAIFIFVSVVIIWRCWQDLRHPAVDPEEELKKLENSPKLVKQPTITERGGEGRVTSTLVRQSSVAAVHENIKQLRSISTTSINVKPLGFKHSSFSEGTGFHPRRYGRSQSSTQSEIMLNTYRHSSGSTNGHNSWRSLGSSREDVFDEEDEIQSKIDLRRKLSTTPEEFVESEDTLNLRERRKLKRQMMTLREEQPLEAPASSKPTKKDINGNVTRTDETNAGQLNSSYESDDEMKESSSQSPPASPIPLRQEDHVKGEPLSSRKDLEEYDKALATFYFSSSLSDSVESIPSIPETDI